MNEELTPLEAIFLLKSNMTNAECIRFGEYVHIIETALKDYDEIKKEKLLLSAVRDLPNLFKKLKALEIIKEKGVNIYFLKNTDNVDEYNELIQPHFGMKALTQEEYDLLKKVLK